MRLEDQVLQFLDSRLDNRYQRWDEIPYLSQLMPEVKQGAQRVVDAFNKNETIYFVHDSDADGVGSAAVMNSIFDFFKYKNRVHRITKREEGYGFLPLHVDEARKEGAKLIITTDNGITSKEAVDYAAANNIDVIITDHHTADRYKFPDKAIIIDPQIGDDSLKDFKQVSGTVVAYLFAEEIAKIIGIDRSHLLQSVALIEELGLTTISDVMNLQHMNRLFVKDAIEYFNNPRKPYTEIFKTNLKYESKVNSETIGFSLAPVLNAANRFGVAEHAYNFLISDSPQIAKQYWDYLNHLNEKRKVVIQQYINMLQGAKIDFGKMIYVNLNNVEKGILGLLANKLAQAYNKPAVVTCTTRDGFVEGSGRSVGQVNMLQILKDCGIEAGGHTHAFGCSFQYDKIPEVVRKLSNHLNSLPDELFAEDDKSNFKITFNQITQSLYKILEDFEPYGHGFERPVFASDVEVVKAYKFGKQNNHTKFILRDVNGDQREIVAFFETRDFIPGDKLQINYTLYWDEWNNDIGARAQQIFKLKEQK